MKEFGEKEALNCELVFEITSQSSAVDIGILVLGGDIEPSYCSVEFWSEAASDGGSCTLKDYPRNMRKAPTFNLISNKLVASLKAPSRHDEQADSPQQCFGPGRSSLALIGRS